MIKVTEGRKERAAYRVGHLEDGRVVRPKLKKLTRETTRRWSSSYLGLTTRRWSSSYLGLTTRR